MPRGSRSLAQFRGRLGPADPRHRTAAPCAVRRPASLAAGERQGNLRVKGTRAGTLTPR